MIYKMLKSSFEFLWIYIHGAIMRIFLIDYDSLGR